MNTKNMIVFGGIGFLASVITVFEFLTPASMPIVEFQHFDACTTDKKQREKFLKLVDFLIPYDGRTVYLGGLVIQESVRCSNYKSEMLYYSDEPNINLSTDNVNGKKYSNIPSRIIPTLGLKLPDFWAKSEYGKAIGGENSYELDGPVSISTRGFEESLQVEVSLGNVSGGAYNEYLCTKKVAERGYVLGKIACILKF